VQWSYELLGEGERRLLDRCSVFFDGFDLPSAAHISDGLDEYTVLDQLDSLVRKSLLTVQRRGSHARYGMLETIRQYAQTQLAAGGGDVRDRHAALFAREVERQWERWDGPDQDEAIDWLVTEFANLRGGYRWASDRGDITTATAIAAHASMLGVAQQRFEPVGWAIQTLEAASAAGVRQLPRLYTAASCCMYLGRPDEGIEYSQAALRLEATGGWDPFAAGVSGGFEATAHLYAGQAERAVEMYEVLASQDTPFQTLNLTALVYNLPAVGRSDDALAIADDAVELIRSRGNPFLIAMVLLGYGRALAHSDPQRAAALMREAHELSRAHPIPFIESLVARDLAELEARHGDIDRALELLDETIASFHRAGQVANVTGTTANLATLFARLDRPEVAATLVGIATQSPRAAVIVDLPDLVARLRSRLGDTATDAAISAGREMHPANGVRYARDQIGRMQQERADHT
jgi:hypothetical protein